MNQPWTIEYSEPCDDEDEIQVYGIEDKNGKRIVTTDCGYYGPRKVDAEYIVRCVNSHDALVEALRSVVDHWHSDMRNFERKEPEYLKQVRNALAQAEKGVPS